MCGRAAQSRRSIESARKLLSPKSPVPHTESNHEHHEQHKEKRIDTLHAEFEDSKNQPFASISKNSTNNVALDNDSVDACITSYHDNFNLSPGMSSIIFHLDTTRESTSTTSADIEQHFITSSEKIWGLCPKSGTINHPLPTGVSKHFSNLMYNARSDTLYEKRTFRGLALEGKTCIWAIDGFFEWKEPDKNVISTQSGKQPYFVHRKDNKPLMIPGLYHKVKTGRKIQKDGDDGNLEDEIIETFTLITTAACQPLRWLHHRQPVFIWDANMNLALEWLCRPSKAVMDQFSKLASDLIEEESVLAWHPVKKEMSKVAYRERDAVDPIRIEKVASVKSFFTAGGMKKDKNTNNCLTSCAKRKLLHVGGSKSTKMAKKKETGGMLQFLSQGIQSPRSGNGSKSKSPSSNKRVMPIKNKVEKKSKGSISHFFSKTG